MSDSRYEAMIDAQEVDRLEGEAFAIALTNHERDHGYTVGGETSFNAGWQAAVRYLRSIPVETPARAVQEERS